MCTEDGLGKEASPAPPHAALHKVAGDALRDDVLKQLPNVLQIPIPYLGQGTTQAPLWCCSGRGSSSGSGGSGVLRPHHRDGEGHSVHIVLQLRLWVYVGAVGGVNEAPHH